MEKKLTKQGAKNRESYTLTLPKEWILKNKIEKSSLVDLVEINNFLLIKNLKKETREIEINLEMYKNVISKILQSLYRKGYKKIVINYKDKRLLKELIEATEKYLLGFEIIETRENKIIIKYIFEESNLNFDTIFRKTFLLSIDLIDIKKNDFERKIIIENILRFSNYLFRILYTKGLTDYEKN